MVDKAAKEKENVIVEAARERFAHFGFNKVTMDEIAADVHMGKASLYYYFPTKENLFEAVLSEEMKEFVNEIETDLKKNISASQKLMEYVKKRLEYFQLLLNLGTLNVYSFYKSKPVFKKSFTEFEKHELHLLERIISEGKKNKEFNSAIKKNTAEILLHILQGLRCRVLRNLKMGSLSEKEYKELQKEMISATNIFINGIRCD